MKILLTAVNARYIHSNPAVYSLRACVEEDFRPFIEIAEYTINNRKEEILADIYRKKPDVIAFSCYIWNWSIIGGLLAELPKILPGVPVWLGGPEVSYNPETVLRRYPAVTGIMTGEGEETFRELAEYYCGGAEYSEEYAGGAERRGGEAGGPGRRKEAAGSKDLDSIRGIVYHIGKAEDGVSEKIFAAEEGAVYGEIRRTPAREPADISALPFWYDDLERFENRILYYESSRGCPFRCSYCLSSIDKRVRLRDIDMVKKELQFFLDHKVKQVKFIDRTFNCNHEHAKEIWRYLAEHDNGVTNFHFEIAADLLTEEELRILGGMRPGLAQMEIGVQTVNPETLREIRRTADFDKIRRAVARIEEGHNIHVHLDLIAGLPYEDYESFLHSFNSVYAMRPQQLQLGFLKVLKGSCLYEKAADYGIRYMDAPPYEVLSTKWLSYGELLRLKQVEEMLELYYNSGQFAFTMPVMQMAFPDAFAMYLCLSEFYREKGYHFNSPSRLYRYQALLDFAACENAGWEEILRQVLTFDLYLRENMKSRPDFARDLSPYRTLIRGLYKKEEKTRRYLPGYAGYDSRQLGKMTHIEVFDYPVWEREPQKRMRKLEAPCMVLFDYRVRDALTCAARYAVIPAEGERISDR
ncbi:MAG: B12-binding domain-containing radical SAM protein [Blautia sp.]|nr:B12-binding domain-containing radical SAM protein [Blautia sp.]MCM1200353.1 B12-binding domain-containing radical SAM protein [Bacteroides fragilis]